MEIRIVSQILSLSPNNNKSKGKRGEKKSGKKGKCSKCGKWGSHTAEECTSGESLKKSEEHLMMADVQEQKDASDNETSAPKDKAAK